MPASVEAVVQATTTTPVVITTVEPPVPAAPTSAVVQPTTQPAKPAPRTSQPKPNPKPTQAPQARKPRDNGDEVRQSAIARARWSAFNVPQPIPSHLLVPRYTG